MAATDARPVPRKNVAYRVTFPIKDADGGLVSGATGLDSEVSKDAAAFADCTNEAIEIGTSGVYYLDITSSEMNADTVVHQTKTSTSGAKTVVNVLYPEEIGDYRVMDTDPPVSQRYISPEFIAIVPKRSSGNVATTAPIRIKTPEAVACGVEFQQILVAGDRLSTIVSIVTTNVQAITFNALGVDRTIAKFTVTGGVAGTTYTVIATVTTVLGNTLEGEFLVIYTT